MNKPDEALQKALQEGLSLRSYLAQGKGKALHDHLCFFLEVLPLSSAIQSALQVVQFEGDLQKKLWKQAAYPAFIFVFAFIMLYVFSTMIIPQLLNSFDMEKNFSFLIRCVHFFEFLCSGIIFFIILLIPTTLYIAQHQKVKLHLYCMLNQHTKFLKDMTSYLFCGYLKELEEKGISTKEAMKYLYKLKSKLLLRVLIESLSLGLGQGEDLLQLIQSSPYLNPAFKQSFQVGSYSDGLAKRLAGFLQQQELYWHRKIHHIAIIVQVIAYSFVAFIVVLVYQIMLVPLTMLENM